MIRYFLAGFLSLFLSSSFAQTADIAAFQQYKQEYKNDLSEIIKKDTAYISFYKFNPKMVVDAEVSLLKDEPVFKFTTSSGKTKDAQKYAQVRFSLNGKTFMVFAYQLLKLKNDPKTADDIFIPFTDFTNSHETYGGGRYLDFKTSDIKSNHLTIDFNKAYNPYCAFVTGFNCPIPPRENDIPTTINAGEKYQAKKFKH